MEREKAENPNAHVAAQTKPPDITPPPPEYARKSFADIVAGSKQEKVIDIKEPSVYKGEPAIFFSKEEIEVLAAPFKYTLVGKFAHGRPSMISIRNFFAKLNLKSNYKIGLLDTKHILIELHAEEDYHRIWLRSQWNIYQYPLEISKWHVDFTPDNESPIVPIWVSLPYLPPHLFSRAAILSIAKLIGTPMKIDASTATLARPSKARICVEVNVTKNLPKRGWIGQGNSGFWQEFTYENVPQYCEQCHKLGHGKSKCIMNDTDRQDTNNRETHDKRQNTIKDLKAQNKTVKPHNAQNKALPQTQNKENTEKQIYILKRDHNTGHVEENTSTKETQEKDAQADINTPIEQTAVETNSTNDDRMDMGKYSDLPSTSHISIPKSLDHLHLAIREEEKINDNNIFYMCTNSLNLSDDERRNKNAREITIQELKEFSNINQSGRESETESGNEGEVHIDAEGFQKVTRRKQYKKNPDLHRNLRSTVKQTQASHQNKINV